MWFAFCLNLSCDWLASSRSCTPPPKVSWSDLQLTPSEDKWYGNGLIRCVWATMRRGEVNPQHIGQPEHTKAAAAAHQRAAVGGRNSNWHTAIACHKCSHYCPFIFFLCLLAWLGLSVCWLCGGVHSGLVVIRTRSHLGPYFGHLKMGSSSFCVGGSLVYSFWDHVAPCWALWWTELVHPSCFWQFGDRCTQCKNKSSFIFILGQVSFRVFVNLVGRAMPR